MYMYLVITTLHRCVCVCKVVNCVCSDDLKDASAKMFPKYTLLQRKKDKSIIDVTCVTLKPFDCVYK